MLISAPLSSLTTYIKQDSECLHFRATDIEFPSLGSAPRQNTAPAKLTILPGALDTAIHDQLSFLTGLPRTEIARNLAPITGEKAYFHLVQDRNTHLQAASLHLPHHHYERVQTKIHRIGPGSTLSFNIPISSTPLASARPGSSRPDPLALLFLLENRITCYALQRLEIAISALPFCPAPMALAPAPLFQDA